MPGLGRRRADSGQDAGLLTGVEWRPTFRTAMFNLAPQIIAAFLAAEGPTLDEHNSIEHVKNNHERQDESEYDDVQPVVLNTNDVQQEEDYPDPGNEGQHPSLDINPQD